MMKTDVPIPCGLHLRACLMPRFLT